MRDDGCVFVFEVVVRRVAVSLHAERKLLAVVAYSDKTTDCVETTVGLFQVEQEAVTKMMGVVDVDRATQSSTVVRGAATPVEADIISQKDRNGAEIDLPQRWRVELEAVPKHQSMAGRRTTERGR